MVTKSAPTSDAPPTKNPSMSSCFASSSQFPAFTEPPYWMRTADATAGDTALAMNARMPACTSCACSGVATFPVPMAHTGSYAMTTLAQSSVEISFTIACSCLRHTSSVAPASRSWSVSPMHAITERPVSMAYLVFLPTNSSDSPHSARRSECPRMTHGTPASTSISAATSPVNAPPAPTQQFCAASWYLRSRVLCTLGRYTMGGAQITSTSAVMSPAFSSFTSFTMEAVLPLHFQLPPTTKRPVPAMATTEREPRPEARPRTEEAAGNARAGLTSDPRVSAFGPETRRRPEKLGLAAARAAEAW
mmetsp:Transcript_10388/g.44192  ORF Transcript_10388/g.44192 Transcript_10388/m.44192 type:complete len:305 (-) Transcript_10388:182-1096(-)